VEGVRERVGEEMVWMRRGCEVVRWGKDVVCWATPSSQPHAPYASSAYSADFWLPMPSRLAGCTAPHSSSSPPNRPPKPPPPSAALREVVRKVRREE